MGGWGLSTFFTIADENSSQCNSTSRGLPNVSNQNSYKSLTINKAKSDMIEAFISDMSKKVDKKEGNSEENTKPKEETKDDETSLFDFE